MSRILASRIFGLNMSIRENLEGLSRFEVVSKWVWCDIRAPASWYAVIQVCERVRSETAPSTRMRNRLPFQTYLPLRGPSAPRTRRNKTSLDASGPGPSEIQFDMDKIRLDHQLVILIHHDQYSMFVHEIALLALPKQK